MFLSRIYKHLIRKTYNYVKFNQNKNFGSKARFFYFDSEGNFEIITREEVIK